MNDFHAAVIEFMNAVNESNRLFREGFDELSTRVIDAEAQIEVLSGLVAHLTATTSSLDSRTAGMILLGGPPDRTDNLEPLDGPWNEPTL